MGKDRETMLAEIKAQMEGNERKNEAFFAKMDKTIKSNEILLKELKSLNKRNDAIWANCGVKVGENDNKNPFVFLEDVLPEAFNGLKSWAEKSKQEALKELADYGFDIKSIRDHKQQKRDLISNKLIPEEETKKNAELKKSVRRVRI